MILQKASPPPSTSLPQADDDRVSSTLFIVRRTGRARHGHLSTPTLTPGQSSAASPPFVSPWREGIASESACTACHELHGYERGRRSESAVPKQATAVLGDVRPQAQPWPVRLQAQPWPEKASAVTFSASARGVSWPGLGSCPSPFVSANRTLGPPPAH